MFRQLSYSLRFPYSKHHRFIILFLPLSVLLISLSMQPLFAQDADGDGITDTLDNCPFYWNTKQMDRDGDGHGDECDNCLYQSNPGQADADGDGLGDACEHHDNVGLELISMTYPHSAGYPISVVCLIQNFGTVDYLPVFYWYHLENEDGIIPPYPIFLASLSLANCFDVVPPAMREWKPEIAPQAIITHSIGQRFP